MAAGYFAGMLRAQAPGNKSAAKNSRPAPATLRVTTRLVQVDVVVQDKKGQPVDGLTQDDFTLLDQGRPQSIASFSQERGDLRQAPIEPLPPNVFTNRFDPAGRASGSVTVILFDALNTPLHDQPYARKQLVSFLRQVQPQDHIAIYFLTSQLKVLLEFSQDPGALLHAVEKLQGHPSPALDVSATNDVPTTSAVGPSAAIGPGAAPDSPPRDLEEFLRVADGQISDFYNINRAETTSAALEAIAHHIAHVPGRKNLVWVSGSFPISIGMDGDTLAPPNREVRHFTREIERAARALNDANIAVYPVDARGLMGPEQFSAANRGPIDPHARLGPDQNNFATMNTLAERTGGHAFYNTNDISGSVRKAVADGQANYELGYYPNHGKWDGAFHEIKLKVRRPGVEVHYRKGYFASAGLPSNAVERQASLDSATASPIDATNLSLRVEVKALPPPDTGTLEFDVGLDLHEILLQESDGRHKGGIEMVFVQKDANARVMSIDSKTIAFNFEQKRYEGFLTSGLVMTRRLPLAPATTQVRLVVRDFQSGATGSVTIPLKSFFAN